MNILKDVKIKGDIFSEYAFLSYTFSFESADEVSAEYSFSLPRNSLVSSLSLFYNNKIIKTKIASASHTAMILQGKEAFATLQRFKNDEYILRINSITKSGLLIMMSVYAPLFENRLSIPLAKTSIGAGKASHTAEITLTALTADSVSSPTHQIHTEHSDNIKVSSGKIVANKDFSIDFTERKKSRFGILQKNITGGELLYKFYPTRPVCFDKNILFIYDTERIVSKSASVMARDFIFSSIKNLNGSFGVAISNKLIGNKFLKSDDTATDFILSELCHIDSIYGDWTEALKFASNNTAVILLTENPNFYDPKQIKNLNIVTFGVASSFGYHIYPNENIEKRAETIIKSVLFRKNLTDCCLKPSNGEARLIDYSYEGGITAYIQYTGSFPKSLLLLCGNFEEEQILDNIKVYDSFAPIGLAYAESEYRLLFDKLKTCSPDEIFNIRKKIEYIGLKYSALNSETALIGSLEGKSAPIRVIIPNEAEDFSGNTVSMFREQTSISDKGFISRCISYIIRDIRSDGAVCTDGEIDLLSRIKLTKICLAALTLSGTDRKILKNSEDFISYSFENKAKAFDFLTSIFKSNELIPNEVPLDLLTAAKAVWQSFKE